MRKWHFFIADSLEVGDIFLSISPELCSTNPHYHIVIYKNNDNGNILVVHTSSEIDKVRARCQGRENIKFDYIEPETMVIIDNYHCRSLTVKSAIDCNKAILKNISYFTQKQYFKKCLPIIDTTIIEVIKNAIRKSPVIALNIIDLL